MTIPQFAKGERVKIKNGTFAGYEGEVLNAIDDMVSVRLGMVDLHTSPYDLEHVSYTPPHPAEVPKDAPLGNHGKMPGRR